MPVLRCLSCPRLVALSLCLSMMVAPLPVLAQGTVLQSFSDIPPSHIAFAAVEYLKAKGIVQGSNGLFKPNDRLTRAQAVKIFVAPLATPDDLAAAGHSGFSDVPANAWFSPYVTLAVKLGIVDPPSKSPVFNPDKPVSKAAFMKMLFSSKKIDALSMFSDITGSLSSDVLAGGWEHPWMRASVTHTVATVNTEAKLLPGDDVMRYQMALFVYRFDMYKAGRRAQAALNETENAIVLALQQLDVKNISEAEYASTRARLTALGALAAKPTEPIVKGAVKTAEGFDKLVSGYKAGVAGQLEDAITYAKEAYALADKARAFSPELNTIATQMQAIAKSMADEARRAMAAPPPAPPQG